MLPNPKATWNPQSFSDNYFLLVFVVVVAAVNIPEVVSRNAAELTALGRIKIRIPSGYLDPTVVRTVMNLLFGKSFWYNFKCFSFAVSNTSLVASLLLQELHDLSFENQKKSCGNKNVYLTIVRTMNASSFRYWETRLSNEQ